MIINHKPIISVCISISIILVVLSSMNITFLEKFQGKTKTITKSGIQNALKESKDTVVYTNTHKSFGNMPSRHFHVRKETQDQSRLQQKSENQLNLKEKQQIHLPSIGSRYSSHKNNNHEFSYRGPVKGLLDKQTNWIIENEIRSTCPQKIQPMNENEGHKLKQNTVKLEKKAKKLEKRSNSSTKGQRLGGLGANIGSEQWQIRRTKQQKALNYAQQLRKIQKQKYSKPQEDSIVSKSNLKFLL